MAALAESLGPSAIPQGEMADLAARKAAFLVGFSGERSRWGVVSQSRLVAAVNPATASLTAASRWK